MILISSVTATKSSSLSSGSLFHEKAEDWTKSKGKELMKENNIDESMLKLPAFRKRIAAKRDIIYYQFGQVVDKKFDGDIGKFKSLFKLFKSLTARASKHRDLEGKTLQHYVQLRMLFRKLFKVGPCTFSVRIDGKVKKVPLVLVSYVLRSAYGIRLIKHGKSLSRNEHWQNFFLPVDTEIDRIYGIYKASKEDLAKEFSSKMKGRQNENAA